VGIIVLSRSRGGTTANKTRGKNLEVLETPTREKKKFNQLLLVKGVEKGEREETNPSTGYKAKKVRKGRKYGGGAKS